MHPHRQPLPHPPPQNIDQMDTVVPQLPVPEIPKPVPVVVNEILVVRLHRSRPDPQIPIQPRRRFLRLLKSDRIAIPWKEEVGLIHVADFAVVDEFDGPPEAAPPAPLRASSGDALVL